MDEKKLYEDAREAALAVGFQYITYLDAGTLTPMQEVRDMCAANTCGMYGKNKACPPDCGSLEECQGKVKEYHWGILLQTVGEIEDSLDFEGMQETESLHKEHFLALAERLRESYPGMLPLGCGCCTVCKQCAGPGEPCRFPEKRISSLEAYGILVSDLCTKNDMKYYYGPGKIAYTSCFLLA